MRFSDLLRISRGRTGLTFRAAHHLTRAIARILGNPEYGIALGMLSDYEAMGRLPRHIAKILSLCIDLLHGCSGVDGIRRCADRRFCETAAAGPRRRCRFTLISGPLPHDSGDWRHRDRLRPLAPGAALA